MRRAYCELGDCHKVNFVDDVSQCADCLYAPEEVLRQRAKRSCKKCKHSFKVLVDEDYSGSVCYIECDKDHDINPFTHKENNCRDFEEKKAWYSFLLFWRK